MEDFTEILVLPFFGQGHIFPCSELCKQFSSHNCKPILIIPSHLSSSIPSDLHHHPTVQLVQIPSSSSPPRPRRHFPDGGNSSEPQEKPHHELGQGIEGFISQRYGDTRTRPAFVVMDVMMSWSKEIFQKLDIPIVSFFTSGACATAMEYAAWKGHVENSGSDETQLLSGLPMGLSYSDAITKRRERPRRHHGRGRGRGGGGGCGRGGGRGRGPPRMGHTRWMDETEGSIAILINTCDDLEAPFLEFLSNQVEKAVFGVGPLLPETFWKSIGSVPNRVNRAANYTEDEVIQWLDSKPRGSVIYVSFGSEVGPTLKEYDELADALMESNQSFIWVIQPGAGRPGPPPGMIANSDHSRREGYEARGLEEKVGERGLIIKGWAPQLAILGHPSTGGFLSHCGWNSTVEGIGCGVPILCWPIRGDQFHDAKLVVEYLRVGYMIANANDVSKMVKKIDIMQGIESVMGDEGVRGRAAALRGVFEGGYPSTSSASLKELIELISSSSSS